MSYLETIKQQVVEARDQEVEDFKTYMEDFCINQFKDSLPHPTAVVYLRGLVDDNINIEAFTKWLKGEGFNVDISADGEMVISYAQD